MSQARISDNSIDIEKIYNKIYDSYKAMTADNTAKEISTILTTKLTPITFGMAEEEVISRLNQFNTLVEHLELELRLERLIKTQAELYKLIDHLVISASLKTRDNSLDNPAKELTKTFIAGFENIASLNILSYSAKNALLIKLSENYLKNLSNLFSSHFDAEAIEDHIQLFFEYFQFYNENFTYFVNKHILEVLNIEKKSDERHSDNNPKNLEELANLLKVFHQEKPNFSIIHVQSEQQPGLSPVTANDSIKLSFADTEEFDENLLSPIPSLNQPCTLFASPMVKSETPVLDEFKQERGFDL